MIINEVCYTILTCLAIWLAGRTGPERRWCYISGVASTPFWLYAAYYTQEFGLLVTTLFCSYSWATGLFNYWIKPTKVEVFNA